MNCIWKRYFLKEFAKVFCLFLGSFYFLYVLIDYSAHTKTLHQEELPFFNVLFYYFCQFSKRGDILIPIALMLSTIKVLTTLNSHNEISALVTGGIPLKTLLRPLLLSATVAMGFLYLNFQIIQPLSLNHLDRFEERYFRENSKDNTPHPVNRLLLKDNSLLLYQSYSPTQQSFFDAYWIRSCDEIYRIKTLSSSDTTAIGHYVDRLIRDDEGQLKRSQSHELLPLPEMEFEEKSLYAAAHPPRLQSISNLFIQLSWRKVVFGMGKMNDREAEIATILFYKLAIPLACLLAVLAPAPFSIRFGRHLPIFLIFALSLFGMISFFTIVNSAIILGKSQVVPPLVAIGSAPLLAFLIFGRKYAQL